MTGPVVTPFGTSLDSGGAITSIAVADQLITCADTPLNLTDEDPCWLAPKLVPVIFTKVPGSPEEGVMPVIHGVTVNVLLANWLPTVTTTL
jgi:hypothetical protein